MGFRKDGSPTSLYVLTRSPPFSPGVVTVTVVGLLGGAILGGDGVRLRGGEVPDGSGRRIPGRKGGHRVQGREVREVRALRHGPGDVGPGDHAELFNRPKVRMSAAELE